MSSGNAKRLGGRKQTVDGVSGRPAIPMFEQLEPRLLLSADVAGLQTSAQVLDNSYEQAIEINIDQQEEAACDSVTAIEAIETLNLDDSDQQTAPAINIQDSSDNSDISTDDASIVYDIGCVTVNLEPVALSSPDVQDNKAAKPQSYENDILSDSETTSIEIRGPPQEDSGVYNIDNDIFDNLTEEIELSRIPDLPGLELVDPDINSWHGQIIYLDFDGAEDVVYNGPVTVGPFDVPRFAVPEELKGQEQEIINQVLAELEQTFAGTGIIFTTSQPTQETEYSTIYIGGDDSAFAEYGSFLGLAEQVDIGNKDCVDVGLVFSEQFSGSSIEDYAANIEDIIAHEIGHLLGYEHFSVDEGIEILANIAAIAPDAARTFTHPAEDGSGDNIHDITLTPETYTFRVDPEPNDDHRVDWFTTYSGTSGLQTTAYLTYWDDEDFTFSSPGTYWVRAELYRSDFWNNTYEWEAVYRWRVNVPAPEIDVERGSTNNVHSHAFGNVNVGSSQSQQFTIRNEGTAALTVSQASGLSSPFSISPANGSGSGDDWVISAGGTRTFSVTFNPSSGTSYSDTLTLTNTDSNESSYQISFTGTGISQTATITDGRIRSGTWVDLDGDGYASALSLEWDAVVNFGTMSVYANIHADSWDRLERDLGNTTSYSLNTSSTSRTFVVPVDTADLDHTTWDFQIDLYQTGTTTRVARLSMGADPQLNDVQLELPSQDVSARWENDSGQELDPSTHYGIGTTVTIGAYGATGQVVAVEVWEDDVFLDDYVCTIDIMIGSEGKGTYAWTIQAIDDGVGSLPEYILKVNGEITSEVLLTSVGDNSVHPSSVVISNVPAYDWWYGCGPTSVGMTAGYWDENGYSNLIPGDASGYTQNVKDIIASQAHITAGEENRPLGSNSEYDGYGDWHNSTSYPNHEANPDSIADFLHTVDGGTSSESYVTGIAQFLSWRGYTDWTVYQDTWSQFSWNELTWAVDAHVPLIIGIDSQGLGTVDHASVAIGYDTTSNQYAALTTWSTDTTPTWFNFGPVTVGSPFGIAYVRYVLPPGVVPGSEIGVTGNGYNIADGNTTPNSTDGTDFGSVVQGQAGPTRTFTVRNTGTAALTLDSMSMTVPTGFTIIEPLNSSIPAGGSDTFSVRLDSSVLGTKSGDISFTNNDADGGDGIENPFNFSITGVVNPPNQPPTIISLSDGPDPVIQGTTLTLTANSISDDHGVASVSFYRDDNTNGIGDPGELLGTDSSSSGGWNWSGAATWAPGTYTYLAQATDDGVPTPVMTSTWVSTTGTVRLPNQAPVLSAIGNRSVDEGSLMTFAASATDSNIPANVLTFSLDPGAPTGASIDPVTGVFTWTPTEAQGPGSYPVTFRVTDDGSPNLDDYEDITITVNEVNQAPILATIGDKSINEGNLLTFTASATDSDIPANALTFSLDPGSPVGASIDPVTGVFTWTPGEDQGPGAYPVTIRVTDDGSPNLDDYEDITITVNEVNQAPVLSTIGDKDVDEGDLLTFTASATDSDIPANALTFSLDPGAPVGASIDPVTGVFTWTPGEDEGPGAYPVTIRVTDDGSPSLDDHEDITVTVNEINAHPVIVTNAGITVSENGTEVINNTELQVTDVDLPAQTLTFTIQTNVTNGMLYKSGTVLAVNDTFTQADINTKNISYEHDGSETITDSFQFTVSDGSGGGIDNTTFNITILEFTLDLDAKGKAQFYDANGDLVTVTLKGGGTGTLYFAHDGSCDIDHIKLTGTNQKSSLTIKTRSGSSTTIGDIIADGPLKSIDARTAGLLGDITVDGWLGKITMDDVADDHFITIGGSEQSKPVTFKFDQVADLFVESDTPIKSITATEWTGGSIVAPWISSLSIKSGDFQTVVTLSGSDTKGIALNKFTVAGKITNSNISVQNGSIKKLTIKGIKGYNGNCFINSNIAAANIDTISLICPQYDNTGVPFGLAADFIKKVTITDNNGRRSYKNLREPEDSIIIQDFEIRLV